MIRQIKWITLGQLANFIIPLILTPVLARRLGLIGFASFAVLTGIAQYATLGVELGLNYAALAEIKRADSRIVQRSIFSETFYLKILLAVLVCAILTMAVSFSKLSAIVDNLTFAVLISGPLVTCIVCPVWFFVLKNRLDINFNIVLGSRIALLLSSWLVVKGPGDYIKAAALFNFATIPFAILYATEWLPNLSRPHLIRARSLFARLGIGFRLFGAMFRETITNVGIAPLYGLVAFDSQFGAYAFAEKIAKILVMPAPIVTGAMIASTPNEQRAISLPSVLTKQPLWTITGIAIVIYGIAAIVVKVGISKFFPQFSPSIPMVLILVGVSPFIYFNYIEQGMRYTKHGRFREAARISYSYLGLLLITSVCLASLYGVWGLVFATCATEILQMILLLNRRKISASS